MYVGMTGSFLTKTNKWILIRFGIQIGHDLDSIIGYSSYVDLKAAGAALVL